MYEKLDAVGLRRLVQEVFGPETVLKTSNEKHNDLLALRDKVFVNFVTGGVRRKTVTSKKGRTVEAVYFRRRRAA